MNPDPSPLIKIDFQRKKNKKPIDANISIKVNILTYSIYTPKTQYSIQKVFYFKKKEK